jgi:methyl-accepting chemotaxis protein
MTFISRRIYFIKKDFQTRFILRFVITATAWAVITVILFVIMAERRLEEVRYSTHIMVKTTSDVLLPSALTAQFITILIFAAALAYAIHSLWMSLAAPLFSLKKDIARIAGGDLVSPVTLREEDEFQDLASELDKMRNDLHHRWARIKERHDRLTEAAGVLHTSVIKGKPSVSHASLLRESVERMKEEINVFKY